MTDTEANEEVRWFKKLIEIRTLTSPVWDVLRPFTKWYFDILKNVMIVAALQYLGEKTGNMVIKGVGYFSAVLISVYFLSYINMWMPSFFNVKNKNMVLVVLDLILVVAIMNGLMYGSNWLIGEVINDLAKAQGSK
jgi:hypothetical protein